MDYEKISPPSIFVAMYCGTSSFEFDQVWLLFVQLSTMDKIRIDVSLMWKQTRNIAVLKMLRPHCPHGS